MASKMLLVLSGCTFSIMECGLRLLINMRAIEAKI